MVLKGRGLRVRLIAALAVALALGVVVLLFLRPTGAPGPLGAWMAEDGVAARFQTIDGLRLRYVRTGEGPPLVLLHGLGSSIYTWKEVLPALALGHDVVAVDLPGFGGSDVPRAPDARVYVRAVEGLLDALGISRASFAGNSLGGAVAVAIAARRRERVDRLVLIDSAGYNYALKDRPWVLRFAGTAPEWVTRLAPMSVLVEMGLRQVFYDDRRVTRDKVHEYLVPMQRPGAAAAVRRLLIAPDPLGFPGIVREVRVPTLVLWGRQDAWIPVADASRFCDDIPGAQVVVLDACGHMPQEEQPAATAQAMVAFLR